MLKIARVFGLLLILCSVIFAYTSEVLEEYPIPGNYGLILGVID